MIIAHQAYFFEIIKDDQLYNHRSRDPITHNNIYRRIMHTLTPPVRIDPAKKKMTRIGQLCKNGCPNIFSSRENILPHHFRIRRALKTIRQKTIYKRIHEIKDEKPKHQQSPHIPLCDSFPDHESSRQHQIHQQRIPGQVDERQL